MIDNYSIIGGGITGCVISLILSKKKKNISIYESSGSIGGVLKDLIYEEDVFFNGVQYLKANTNWLNLLKKKNFFKKELIFFNNKNASYTDFDGMEIYSDDFPCPVFNIKVKDEKLPNLKEIISLKDRLSLYPKEISNHLLNWVSKFGVDCNLLSNECAENGLMLLRILPLKNSPEELIKLKNKNKTFDKLYGLPRKKLGLSDIKVAVPKSGFNKFFLELEKYLSEKNIKINLKSVIKPIWKKKKLIINNISDSILSKKIIWTANPTSLIFNFNKKKIDSCPVMVKIFTANLDADFKDFFYINVFSDNLDIFRMYIYKINNKPKITLECFDSINSLNNHIEKIDKIFLKFGYKINLSKVKKFNLKRQKKFFLVTNNDKKIFNDFYKNIKISNLVTGSWESYHREKKINEILSQLNL